MFSAMVLCVLLLFVFFFFFFFFQAEDGIRDLYVTGVQTCALPICHFVRRSPGSPERSSNEMAMPGCQQLPCSCALLEVPARASALSSAGVCSSSWKERRTTMSGRV